MAFWLLLHILALAQAHRPDPGRTTAVTLSAKATGHIKLQPNNSSLVQKVEVSAGYGHPEWLASCKKIYLDVGSNKGVQIKKFFEPEQFPGALALPLFDKAFGSAEVRSKPSADTGLCVLGVEANPSHQDELKLLEDEYRARGWNVHFYFFAAGHSEGNVTFGIEDNTKGNRKHQLGAQVITGEKHVPSAIASTKVVRAVDFAAFVGSLPAHTVSLMKMDIEGAEWQVLPRLAEEHALCKGVIEATYMEVHTGFGDSKFWNGPRTEAGVQAFVSQQACPKGKMVLSFVDDETYGDGEPAGRSLALLFRHDIALVVGFVVTLACLIGFMYYFASKHLVPEKTKGKPES